jgi:hypothetical protein
MITLSYSRFVVVVAILEIMLSDVVLFCVVLYLCLLLLHSLEISNINLNAIAAVEISQKYPGVNS